MTLVHNLFIDTNFIIILHITATENLDFRSVSNTLVFQDGSRDSTTLCINVTIIDDLRVEGEEIFNVILHTVDQAVVFRTDSTTIVIMDNEGNCIALVFYFSKNGASFQWLLVFLRILLTKMSQD